jgi:hypothetical protein
MRRVRRYYSRYPLLGGQEKELTAAILTRSKTLVSSGHQNSA